MVTNVWPLISARPAAGAILQDTLFYSNPMRDIVFIFRSEGMGSARVSSLT